jgi:putrescine transport system ATP-binding protein
MTLSTRIAVMEKGRFLQVGQPKEIYEYPESRFVADFVGTKNMFEGTVTRVGDETISVDCPDISTEVKALPTDGIAAGEDVCIALRPEKIFLSKEKPDEDDVVSVPAVVDDLGYLGNLSRYRIKLESGRIITVSRQNRRRSHRRFVEWDDKVWLSWHPRSAVVITGKD